MLQKPSQSKVVEITAVFLRERIRFDNSDTMIGDIRVVDAPDYDFGGFPCSIKGESKEDELRERGTYRFYGKWQRYTNRRTKETENQFCFVSAVESLPLDRDSVIAYLVAKGKGNGIGRARAANLADKFGSDAVRVCREEPMVALAAVRGVKSLKAWSEEDAISLAAALQVDRFREVCHIELMGLLRGRGFPKKTADEAMRKWGNRASEIIKSDPHKLMHFRGCGFKRTDAMYLSLGGDPRRMKRQALCVWYSLASDSSGDTWLPLDQIVTQLNRQIGASANPVYAVKLAKRARMIDAKMDVDKKIWLAEFKKSNHEQRVSELVKLAQAESSCRWFDHMNNLDSRLSDHQREKLSNVLSVEKQPTIWSLAGSPGTGKTFSGAAVIRELGELHGWDSIAVCAPTGKAAVRITESLAEYKIPLSARTIHSTLGVGLPDDSGNWSFQHNEANPLPVRFIVADECFIAGTMIDIDFGEMPIELVKPGQKIWNASGLDYVVATSRKVATHVTKINVGKTEIVCSPSHRLFTDRGFVFASEIKPGDTIIRTVEAMRLLRKAGQAEAQEQCYDSFLQHALLNEMVDAVPGIQKPGVHSGTCEKMRCWSNEISEFRESGSCRANRKDSQFETNEEPVFSGCVFEETSGNQTQATSSGRERERTYKAASRTNESDRGWMGYRVRGERMGENSRLSDMLQTGPCESEEADCNRDRRSFTRCCEAKTEGPQENCVSLGERVDRVKTYESSHNELDQFRDADGFIYLYDLQAARHKSYSVERFLVHNCSMIDAGLMSSLLAARAKGTGILFIGDINQLAPVGHGAPLRDMIAAGLPTAELVEIQRNSGRIVHACAAIRDGKRFEFSEKLDEANGENLFLVSRKPQIEMVKSVLDGMARKGFDRVWGCQVLTAVNRKSELSRKELNKILQQHLNPNSLIPGSPFRVGDKIVNTKNKFFRALMSDETSEDLQTNDKGEVYVANGELAKILEVDNGKIVAQLWNPDRTIEIYRSVERSDDNQPGGESDSEESDTGCTFDLGYALSVHKFQGSETPVAIVMLDPYPGAKLVCSREWIYTGISRAKKICICIGEMNDAYSMVSRQSLWKRKTFLKELIQG